MAGIGGLIFGLAALLVVVAFLPALGQRLRLPFTVLLAGLGCVLGIAVSLLGHYGENVPDWLRELLSVAGGKSVTDHAVSSAGCLPK